ncbi:hypothetical protein ACRAKI_26130 [Saccharothrix isguenensis]
MRRRILDAEVTSGGAVRAPLAAAAAVAVLAAGGAIIAQSTQGDTIAASPPSTTSSTAGPSRHDESAVSVSPGATPDDVARCAFGEADVRFTLGLAGRRILVAADNRFCELTHTSISHNRPEAGAVPFAGGAASVLWRTGSGVLIGRVPVGTVGVGLATGAQTGSVAPLPVTLVEELFVVPFPAARMTAEFATTAAPVTGEVDLAVLPDQDVWSAVREELPPGDPDVARCLNLTLLDGATWVGDPLKWRPGAFPGPADHTWLVIHDQAGTTAYCPIENGRVDRARLGDVTPQDGALVKVRYSATIGGHGPADSSLVLAGTVDAAEVGGIEITDALGRTAPAVLRDGTFAVLLVDQPPGDATTETRDVRATVFDHENRVIATIPM